jgi:DNA-binding MarR family transcriptional regulator
MPTVHPNVPKFEILRQLGAEHPGLDATAIHTCVTLLRVASEISSVFDRHFARFGLSQGRFTVLMRLRRHAVGLSPAALAESAGVTRPTISGVLDTLQRDGLVERTPAAFDHRSSVVTLTASARRLMKRMLPVIFRTHAEIMAGLTVRERRALVDLLKRVDRAPAVGARP